MSGVAVWEPGEAAPGLHDGATISRTRKNNWELEFPKASRWRGYDQLKIAPESGTNGQGGAMVCLRDPKLTYQPECFVCAGVLSWCCG